MCKAKTKTTQSQKNTLGLVACLRTPLIYITRTTHTYTHTSDTHITYEHLTHTSRTHHTGRIHTSYTDTSHTHTAHIPYHTDHMHPYITYHSHSLIIPIPYMHQMHVHTIYTNKNFQKIMIIKRPKPSIQCLE